MKFVHLHTHSHYSLLDGLAKIDDLVTRSKELGMEALAITDHGNLYGAVEFYKKARKAGIKPILGVEAYVAPTSRFQKESNERYFHLILLAENLAGWKNLIQLITKAHLEGFYYRPRIDKELLRQYHGGLIALSACLGGEISRLIMANQFENAKRVALEYQEIFGKGNFFVEIWHHPNIPEALKAGEGLLRLAKETNLPLVATHDIHYLKPEDADFHDILLAVQTGNKLSDDDRLSLKADDFSMTSPEQMAEFFKELPEAVENTTKIAERCNVQLTLGQIYLPKFSCPENETADSYLQKLLSEKISERFPNSELSGAIKERLDYELAVVQKTGFADYFLIVQDLVNWAKNHGIAVGPGRGSAAGSLVAYVLGITDIDPIKYELLFERFLNPDRVQMPDIDIDFTDTRRDEVFAYLRQKYGEDRVAQIITFGTMAARAAIRDAGRALGFSYGFCDQLAKLIPFNAKLEEALEQVAELKQLAENNPDAKKLIEAARHLEGVARHASVHACGIVIAKEALTDYLPLQIAPQDKASIITQFEMHSIEDLGLLKIDLLGLKNLTTIEKTSRLIKENYGEEIKISDLPLNDQKTFELLRAGDTTGVFQLEGSGMRHYLKDLKPTELDDIIAMIALYRPGPLDAGMVPKYIARKNGREKVVYLHPKLEPILKKTYGIAVYQEQLMQIARELAGFTLSEADTLRKAVGKKIKSLLDEQAQKMINGMIKNGIEPKLAEEIWRWFEPFARYGFNRSHAACYGIIGYRTAYLKAHYPVEFITSLFNADLQDIDRIAFLVTEARKHKLEVFSPDVNKSLIFFAPEERGIRFGLLAIKNIGEGIAEAIIEERLKSGPYQTIEDFLGRLRHKDLNKKSLESLIKSGAIDSLGRERNLMLQNLEDLLRYNLTIRRAMQSAAASLFQTPTFSNLKLKPAPEAAPTEKLIWEKELLGLYLSDHPLNRYQEKIKSLNTMSIDQIKNLKQESSNCQLIALVSNIKRITTRTGQPMLFVEMKDSSQEPLEVVVFNNILAKTLPLWQENKVLLVEGRTSWRDNEPKMICEKAVSLD